LVDALSIYDHIRKGITQTLPLFGALPGNENGASFVLFRRQTKPEITSTAKLVVATAPSTAATMTIRKTFGSLTVHAATAGTLYLRMASIW
jgi:hypothetical protein